jgi:hypothetical protein
MSTTPVHLSFHAFISYCLGFISFFCLCLNKFWGSSKQSTMTRMAKSTINKKVCTPEVNPTKLQPVQEMDLIANIMELVERGHTGWTDNNRSVLLLCLYLFEYQDAFQMNTNIQIIRIMDILMRTLPSSVFSSKF